MKSHRALPLFAYLIPLSLIVYAPCALAKDKAGSRNPGDQTRIEVNKAALQELLEERCELESEHRLTQDNPEKQTQDDFVFLCMNRWETRLQGK